MTSTTTVGELEGIAREAENEFYKNGSRSIHLRRIILNACKRALAVKAEGEEEVSAKPNVQPQGQITEETGIALVAKERARQLNEEGWTAEHDDGHTDGELATADEELTGKAVA